MKYKKFDWVIARKINSPQRWDWLFQNNKNLITEDEFISAMRLLKRYSRSDYNNKHANYQPSNLKKQYKYLKERFGFFNENKNG